MSITLQCEECGREFTPSGGRNDWFEYFELDCGDMAHFCSQACAEEYEEDYTPEVTCAICGCDAYAEDASPVITGEGEIICVSCVAEGYAGD